MKIKFITIVLLGFAILGYGQTTQRLTLSDAMELSTNNNSQIKISEAKLNTMSSKVNEAKSNMLPDLKLNGMFLKPFNSTTIHSGIPTIPSRTDPPDYVALQQLNLGFPLFAGFKIKNGIAIAQYQENAQTFQLENDKQDIALLAVNGLINLYKAKQAIKVIEENLLQAHQRSLDFEKMEKNGIIARNDLMSVQLQESNVKLSLADAKKNINVLNYNLAVVLGLPENTQIEPDITEDENRILLNEGEIQQKSVSQRMEYKILHEQEKIGVKNVELGKAAYYPTISATAGYTNLWMPNLLQINHSTNIGLSLNYNLSSWYKNRAAVETAKLQRIEIDENKKALNDKIKTEIHNAFEDYNLQAEKIKVYNEAVGQANENYRVVKNKFNNGLATTTDLLTADVEQLQAQLNLIYGLADKKSSYFNLLRQSGELQFNNNKQ